MSELTLPAAPTTVEPAPAPPRRRRGLVVGAIVAAVFVLGGVLVFVADSDEAKAGPLALVFTPGETQRYRIEQTMNLTLGGDLTGVSDVAGMPFAVETSQLLSWTVKDVDADGVATIRVTSDDVSATVNGAPVPSMGATPPVDVRISRTGRVLSIGGPALGGTDLDLSAFTKLFDTAGTGQMTPLLPPGGDAQPGDTWDTSFSQDIPFGDGSVDVTATSRYDRDETVDGTDAAVIVSDADLAMDLRLDLAALIGALGGADLPTGASGIGDLTEGALSYTGGGSTTQTSWLDLEAQRVLRTESSGDLDVTMELSGVPGFSGTLTVTGSITQRMSRP